MTLAASTLAFGLLLWTQPAPTQPAEADAMVLAQALDRCMATQAVRLTHTSAADAAIYAQARQSCSPLRDRLRAAISAQLSQADAAGLLQAMDAQAEPNFMNMLARIRSDRARRSGG